MSSSAVPDLTQVIFLIGFWLWISQPSCGPEGRHQKKKIFVCQTLPETEGGGLTHAICWQFFKSPKLINLYSKLLMLVCVLVIFVIIIIKISILASLSSTLLFSSQWHYSIRLFLAPQGALFAFVRFYTSYRYTAGHFSRFSLHQSLNPTSP